jgi:hypothetical protein
MFFELMAEMGRVLVFEIKCHDFCGQSKDQQFFGSIKSMAGQPGVRGQVKMLQTMALEMAQGDPQSLCQNARPKIGTSGELLPIRDSIQATSHPFEELTIHLISHTH